MPDGRGGAGPLPLTLVDVLAEIAAVDQFLQDDELRTAPRRLADMPLDLVEIGVEVITECELDCCDNELWHFTHPILIDCT